MGNGMSRQYCPGCVFCRLGSQNGPSSSFGWTDEVPLFPFAALFILWNFKLFLFLVLFKIIFCDPNMNQDEAMNFSSFIFNRQTKMKTIVLHAFCLFVCFCFWHRFLLYDSSAGQERNWCKEFSNVFLKSCRGYAYQHTDSLMSDSGGAISCS